MVALAVLAALEVFAVFAVLELMELMVHRKSLREEAAQTDRLDPEGNPSLRFSLDSLLSLGSLVQLPKPRWASSS